MKSILFVDDDDNILQGLQRMLRPMHKEWDMSFVGSGQEALDYLAKKPVDVIVSDMRMPGMDGATLLAKVMERYPQTIRLILSGQTDRDTIFRAIGPTHQFLAKPCDSEVLKATINRAFALRELLRNESLMRLASQLGTLPAMPGLYVSLIKELKSPDSSLAGVAHIIESDVAMTAKILQYVNSAFFGIRQRVASPAQAVSLLGMDIIRSLVLVAGIFAQEADAHFPVSFFPDAFADHSLRVGAYSRAIAKNLGLSEWDTSDAFTAGVLHDVGSLILASRRPEEYECVLQTIQKEPITKEEAEIAVFGSPHTAVGAYLLGLWGFPDAIVESVALHTAPELNLSREYSPMLAVHVANVFAWQLAGGERIVPPQISQAYVTECGYDTYLPKWLEVCKAISSEDS